MIFKRYDFPFQFYEIIHEISLEYYEISLEYYEISLEYYEISLK